MAEVLLCHGKSKCATNNIGYGSVNLRCLGNPRQLESNASEAASPHLEMFNIKSCSCGMSECLDVVSHSRFQQWRATTLTLHAAAAGLQHPGVHVGLWVGQQLVSSQVRVVRGGDEVVAKRLVHVLVHLVVQRVENVTGRASHETRETCLKIKFEESRVSILGETVSCRRLY